ncbi:MAG: hypothetical protein AAB437_01925 [Patescibacteria group bacterium]
MNVNNILEKIVFDFFIAFDEKNTVKISQLCLPETEIVQHNGVITNLSEMNQIIKNTKNWYPRERKLSEFKTLIGNPYSVIYFKNYIIFKLPDNKIVEEKYRETWIFKKDSLNAWKPIRIHYCSITQEKHSEEVK